MSLQNFIEQFPQNCKFTRTALRAYLRQVEYIEKIRADYERKSAKILHI